MDRVSELLFYRLWLVRGLHVFEQECPDRVIMQAHGHNAENCSQSTIIGKKV